nr:protein dpy-30 homolog isoform X1 [Halyomorpha halys]
MLKENIQEVLEEVQAKVSEFTSKRHNVESINDSSSDSDIAEEGNEEIDLETCSARAYIEHTVGLILMNGLTILERERPENPIKWLARYLLFNKDQPPHMIGEFFEQEGFEPIKLPEHIKQVIIEDTKDLDIEIVNKLV